MGRLAQTLGLTNTMYVHLVAPLNHNLIVPQAQLVILGLPATADKVGVELNR